MAEVKSHSTGDSFIAGPMAEIIASADDKEEAFLTAQFNLDKI